MRSGPLEITDLLWPVDQAGRRLPVVRSNAIEALRERGQHRAARLVAGMPASGDDILESYLDGLGLRVHYELQRLSEELQLHRRVGALLEDPIRRLQAASPDPIHLVDVGCGLGHVIRSLAVRKLLDEGVQLLGVDLNPVLVREADGLAEREGARCRFVAGDAFAPGSAIEQPARTIVISTGLLHHLGETELAEFFAAQTRLGVAGFAHWDIAPCLWSTVGAWVLHQARMREPVSRHDGVLSARRAHSAQTLLAAVGTGAPGYASHVIEGPRWYPRTLDVLRPVVGWRE